MTALDRLIRSWRESKVRPYLRSDARVLDIGCGDGTLFQRFPGLFRVGVGIDPALGQNASTPTYRLISGTFPEDVQGEAPFDVITLLAVLEHIPEAHQVRVAEQIAACLAKEGYLVITVPSPRVDVILDGLRALKLIDGMALEQHYGFHADRTPDIFGAAGLELRAWKRFQLGLNNLFVFQKP